MYLPDFAYFAPASLSDACELLAQNSGRAKVISGGTDLLVKMKHSLVIPEVLVSLKNFEQLKKIEYVAGKGVIIGARATHNDLISSLILNKKYLSVSEAAHQMAANQIRNVGTVGGNICSAVPSADLPPILIALGATVTLTGTKNERTMPLEQFFTGPGKSVMANDEILKEIVIPDSGATGSTYIKFGLRRSGALAVVGVAVAVTVEGNEIKEARVALGAVAPTPMLAKETSDFLRGKTINDDLFENAGVIAARECNPISDIRGSAEYRRDMVRVYTKRALHKAINEGHV